MSDDIDWLKIGLDAAGNAKDYSLAIAAWLFVFGYQTEVELKEAIHMDFGKLADEDLQNLIDNAIASGYVDQIEDGRYAASQKWISEYSMPKKNNGPLAE